MNHSEIQSLIEEKFPNSLIANENLQGNQIEIDGQFWKDIATFLKNDPKLLFDQLECITGIDTGDDGPLQSRYNLHSMELRHKIEVIISLDRDNPSVESIEQIWRIGDWFERETYDMYGINFVDHPNPKRLLMPEDWRGWPLRKDYIQPDFYELQDAY